MRKSVEIFKQHNKKVESLTWNQDEQCYTSLIYDAELDPVSITLSPEDHITINTGGYDYISLDRDNLSVLRKLLNRAMSKYKKIELSEE